MFYNLTGNAETELLHVTFPNGTVDGSQKVTFTAVGKNGIAYFIITPQTSQKITFRAVSKACLTYLIITTTNLRKSFSQL